MYARKIHHGVGAWAVILSERIEVLNGAQLTACE